MDQEWHATYNTIREKHDESLTTLYEAKKDDENGKVDTALANYKLTLSLIDEALATPVALPDDLDNVDETWHVALQMVQKLKRNRAEILHRIAILSPTTSVDKSNVTTEEVAANGSSTSKRPRTFMELAEALQNLEFSGCDVHNLPKVLDLLFSCENVKLYHINTNGEVTTTSESSTLRIIRLDQDVTQNFDATYFMQIIRSSDAETIGRETDDLEDLEDEDIENALEADDEEAVDERPAPVKKQRANTPPKPSDPSLIYPLVPAVSPCFRTEYGAFIFPDIESDEPGSAYGILVPSPADEIVLEILESLLLGVVRQQPTTAPEPTLYSTQSIFGEEEQKRDRRYASERISDNIVQGACFISNSLVKGTEQLGKVVSYTTPYVISKMNKAPNNAPPVSGKAKTGIEIAKTATGVAVGVTGFVANKVGSATMALGRFLAPHVHAQGSKLLSKTMGYGEDEAAGKMGGVLVVAAGAVEGFGTVYTGLEKSAGILGKNLSENSVKIIEHKYGPSAAVLAGDTFDTVGNMINLSQNMNLITPKGLAKKTFKGTGKAIITDFKPKTPATNYVPAGALYPDLTEFSKKLAQPKF